MLDQLSGGELVLRILVAGLLGGLVGLDRELSDQPAGLRTHILVSLGSALFTMVGAYGLGGFQADPDRALDPTRVAAQVVTGIGFLGAGAIIRQGASIRGLTTAAGLWVTAAIGMAVGFGYWLGAFVTSVAAVLSLFGLKRVEGRLLQRLKPGKFQYEIDARQPLMMSEVIQVLDREGCRIDSVKMDEQETDESHLFLRVRLPPRLAPEQIADQLRQIDNVFRVSWTR